MSDPAWRLLVDGPARGAWNMAVDEAILVGVAAGTTQPTLRFYQWSPPCLSLGYFQPFSSVDPDACRALGIDVVRRPTGGRAILHDAELTYSLALPASVLGHDAGILPSYHRISAALRAGLGLVGVATTMAPESAAPTTVERGPICFDRPSAHEILLDGRKLVGSAQVRRENAILQHGSILIEPRIERMVACLRWDGSAPRAVAAGVVGLAEVGIRNPTQLARAIATAVAREFAVELTDSVLSRDETALAGRLMTTKYQSSSWIERPLPPAAINTTRTR